MCVLEKTMEILLYSFVIFQEIIFIIMVSLGTKHAFFILNPT